MLARVDCGPGLAHSPAHAWIAEQGLWLRLHERIAFLRLERSLGLADRPRIAGQRVVFPVSFGRDG